MWSNHASVGLPTHRWRGKYPLLQAGIVSWAVQMMRVCIVRYGVRCGCVHCLQMMMTSNSVRVGCVHACKCPLNPRNRGAAASPCKTNTGSLLTPMRCGGAQSDTPINMNPFLAWKQRLIVAHMDCPVLAPPANAKQVPPIGHQTIHRELN